VCVWVGGTLHYLHERYIVHKCVCMSVCVCVCVFVSIRDLKVSNLLMTDVGCVKIGN